MITKYSHYPNQARVSEKPHVFIEVVFYDVTDALFYRLHRSWYFPVAWYLFMIKDAKALDHSASVMYVASF